MKMAEYIERRTAIEHLNVWCGGCGSAVECILAEPAADVAQVMRCKDCENSVEISDGSFCGACLKIHVHGAVKPFRHTFAKAHVFGRDVTVYQGDRPNTLIIKGTEPEGFYETPGGAT